jgi:hypothetical protein
LREAYVGADAMVSVALHERDLNLVGPDPKVIEQPAGRADGAPRTDESAADGQDTLRPGGSLPLVPG